MGRSRPVLAVVNGDDWRRRALCRGRGDVWLSPDPATQQIAAEMCASCPVIEECAALADGLATSLATKERVVLPGVWAGRVRGRPVPAGDL